MYLSAISQGVPSTQHRPKNRPPAHVPSVRGQRPSSEIPPAHVPSERGQRPSSKKPPVQIPFTDRSFAVSAVMPWCAKDVGAQSGILDGRAGFWTGRRRAGAWHALLFSLSLLLRRMLFVLFVLFVLSTFCLRAIKKYISSAFSAFFCMANPLIIVLYITVFPGTFVFQARKNCRD